MLYCIVMIDLGHAFQLPMQVFESTPIPIEQEL